MDEASNKKPSPAGDSTSSPSNPPASVAPILFFDGVCGLCNASVDWVMARDHREHFRFSPLQGKTAADLLSEKDRLELASIILFEPGLQPPLVTRKSEAVRKILTHLGGPWRAIALLMGLVPLSLRDAAYDVVARVRYKVWGQRETCRMPTPAERRRFLD